MLESRSYDITAVTNEVKEEPTTNKSSSAVSNTHRALEFLSHTKTAMIVEPLENLLEYFKQVDNPNKQLFPADVTFSCFDIRIYTHRYKHKLWKKLDVIFCEKRTPIIFVVLDSQTNVWLVIFG